MEKAERYTDKAIVQISKMRAHSDAPILSTFQVMLTEHMIQCRLVMGNKTKAISELGMLTKLLSGNTLLLGQHRAQLHTLLGLYAMSMNCMEAAESQLNCALRTSKERELWTFANLNLAIVYLRQRRDQDFMARVKEGVLPLGIRPRGNMPRRQEGDLLMMMRTKILMIQIIDKHFYNIVITSHFYISNISRNIYVKIISQLYIYDIFSVNLNRMLYKS